MLDGDHIHSDNNKFGLHNHKKIFVCGIFALILALAAYSLAQSAQDTADINNILEIVVNNTNLAPSVAGHPPGTGERVNGVTYWANDSPIEVFVFAHASSAGATAEIHLFINGTKVADTSGRPLGAAEESNKTIIAIIPRGANYSFEFNNAQHYEWREYIVLSGKNGTLSVNQTFITNGSSFNSTYDAYGSSKVNKSGDKMTGELIINKTDGTGVTTVLNLGLTNSPTSSNLTINPDNGAFNFRVNQNPDNSLQYSLWTGWSFAMRPQSDQWALVRNNSYGTQEVIGGVGNSTVFAKGNFSVVDAGKGTIYKSQDGTKCGFHYWGNDNLPHDVAITCP